MRRASNLVLSAALALVAASCGGAARSDLVSGDPGYGGGPADAGSSRDSGATPGADAGAQPDASVPPRDAGPGPGPAVDAGPPDAGRDAGPPPGSTFRCGGPSSGLACDKATQDCCAVGSSTGRPTYTCELFGDCPNSAVPLECATSADCEGGKVCCGYLQSNTWYSVECASSCGSSGSYTGVRMCTPGAPNPCPNGGTCTPSQKLVGYAYCSN